MWRPTTSFLLKLPVDELEAIERARGAVRRLTWVRAVLREACERAGEPPALVRRSSPRRSTADPRTRREQAARVLEATSRVTPSSQAKRGVRPIPRDVSDGFR